MFRVMGCFATLVFIVFLVIISLTSPMNPITWAIWIGTIIFWGMGRIRRNK